MLERLDYVKLAPGCILDAGAGPSPQAAQLLKRYRGARLIALDFSLPLLQTIRKQTLIERLARRPAVAALCADFGHIPLASGCCTMVWSNMALHWASDPQAAIGEFHRVLEVEGLLMFSTIGPDTLRELRAAFSGVDRSPHVHGFVDMHDIGDMLVDAGFAAPVMDTEKITLTYPGVAAMVADLRATGQTCSLVGRSRGLLGKGRWRRVGQALERGFREGRLPATVEVVYGHAWKAASQRTRDGHAIVNFDPVPHKPHKRN